MRIPNFFPSRTVAFYMGRMFLIRTFAIVAGLVLILQTLDLLSESGRILAYPGNGDPEVWRYVSLRTPQIIAFVLPFSTLLGTIITLSTLNQNSEIVALRSSGLSAHQVLAPLLLAALGVSALSFTFNDRIVTRATATLDQWKDVDYGPIPIDRGDRTNVWVRDGNDLVEAAQVHGKGDAVQLHGITIYQRQGGSLHSIVMADSGKRTGNAWTLTDARQFDVGSDKAQKIGTIRFGANIRPDQFTLANVDAAGMSFGGLSQAIGELESAGRPTGSLKAELWHKISDPLSALLMPLLGAVAAFGVARSGKLFVRAVIGMMLGFAYFVADNFALAMGDMGAYPPFLAAWAPFLLFLLIGESVLFRTEE
ncbi:LPS export ABC transporter permease LptG [Stakelama sediminis]|uniref:Lipopolysaccharide export system permease protein n=1 Tax=Stakelama sediminis TaxID=463200 RepID=A0A840Z0D9_9SPHN|nr:LPS export ABC transporter permease LptG [Stakelama sediminis]MBB5719438.1 lipopolysaccharide export system permease protein [Stakelama sediminis]